MLSIDPITLIFIIAIASRVCISVKIKTNRKGKPGLMACFRVASDQVLRQAGPCRGASVCIVCSA